MQVYNVGPDQEHPGDEYSKRFVWMVIWYQREDYEGDGEAVALGHNGKLYFKGLSHCSCYGPFEELENGNFESVSVEEYLKSDSIHDTDTENIKIRNKVTELLKAEEKMILQVGKKYATKYSLIYTIISTNRKSEDGYNVVAECERTDDRGNKCPVFQRFTPDGKNADEEEFSLVKEYRPKLKVQFTIDLPESLVGLSMDEIDSLMLDWLKGLTPSIGPCFKWGDLDNANKVICSYEN